MLIGQFEEREFQAALNLLGGREVLGRTPDNLLELHDMIVEGFPPQVLAELIEALPLIMHDGRHTSAIFGLKVNEMDALAGNPGRLDVVLSDRIWRFAIVAALIIDLFGEMDAAERNMMARNPYLKDRAPIDYLSTATGSRLVYEHFKRIEYGIHV
jgi:putative toxin-antitoxin system antitoxin component (TIGR02293 family)